MESPQFDTSLQPRYPLKTKGYQAAHVPSSFAYSMAKYGGNALAAGFMDYP
jgi:hypothetical protein